MKQYERKEQNRRAAMRCRERKKEELKILQKVCTMKNIYRLYTTYEKLNEYLQMQNNVF